MASHHDVDKELRDLLHAQNMRATAVRLAVLTSLHQTQGPMTHEQIMTSLASREYDRSSVWRLLSDLSDKGILRRMDLGDRVWRYELVDACRPIDAAHTHFMCGECGDVSCLPPLELATRGGQLPDVLNQAEYTIRIEGTCGDCLSA